VDALRRLLHLRPFERPLRGAGDDLEPIAYISGKIETDEGVLGDQAIAIVPVEILCV
jgi:hypothetical protein